MREDSVSSHDKLERHIKSILSNDLSSLPEILSVIPRDDWGVFADHLYAYHLEQDAWPIMLWAITQRTSDDLTLNEEQFHDMIIKRNLFSDLMVRWTRSLIKDFYEKAKLIYTEFDDFDTAEEKEKICELLSIFMRIFAELNPEDIPLLGLKPGTFFHNLVGHGDDILSNAHFFLISKSFLPLISNPTLVNLDDLGYVRPQKLQNLLNECVRVKREPTIEPYQSLMVHWATITAARTNIYYNWKTVEMMEKIWKAQNVPNVKKMKRLEEMMRELITDHSDDAASDSGSIISQIGVGQLSERLSDERWKAVKSKEGVTEYSWSAGGVAARVEAEMKGEAGQTRRIVEKMVEEVLRNVKLFTKQEIECVDKDISAVQFRVSAPFPFSPRYISADIHYHTTSNGDSSAIMYQSDRHKTPSGHQRAKMLLSGIQVTAKGRDRVRVTVMLHMDMCSSIPNWAASGQSSAMRKNIGKILRVKRGTVNPPIGARHVFAKAVVSTKQKRQRSNRMSLSDFPRKTSRGSFPPSDKLERHFKAILSNDFTSLPDVLAIIPRDDWNVFADHLYAYHLEEDAWPLTLWALSQRPSEDLTLNEEQFHDMIIKRNLFSDLMVRCNRGIIEGLYRKAKSTYTEFENFDTEEEKQKICEMLSIFMKTFAELNPEDIPLLGLKPGTFFHYLVGHGDDYLCNSHFFLIEKSLATIVSNPTLVNLDDLNYVRPQKLQNLLDECARLLRLYGKVKREPTIEPYQSLMVHWATITAARTETHYNWTTVEMMEKIWKAQNVPNVKKMKRLEEMMRELISDHSDDAASDSGSIISQGLGQLSERLSDERWKPTKTKRGITEYSWSAGGVAARVEAEMEGDVSQTRKIVEKMVEEVVRSTKLFSKQEIECVDKDISAVQFRVSAPFPFSPRYISADIHYHTTSNGDSSAVIYQSDRHKTPSGHQRAKMLLSGIQVTAKGRDRVRVTVMVHMDMCSSIPNWAASGQSSAIKKDLSRILRDHQTI
ncbi:hypothetical protein PROFUN_05218 [Planoprotostelium fungivorum]|uniref:START domain-containing protein n=1 Tax=Planoprotostelium fungivorum TaxID=1890364 RepID=A0A2P6NRN8_9EUKA|nr:hypothetical protein PROFUN_05218 [Planoprotostelium fungivorum]